MKYVREAGLRNINQSHTAQQELYQTVLTLQSLSHTCMTFFLRLNFQKSLRTEVNMWTCPTQGSGGLRWAQVSTGELRWAQVSRLKDWRIWDDAAGQHRSGLRERVQVVPDKRQHGEQTGDGADQQTTVHQLEVLHVTILLQEHLKRAHTGRVSDQRQEGYWRIFQNKSMKSTFLAASSREFFTAAPSHLSIFTGFSSILHWNTNNSRFIDWSQSQDRLNNSVYHNLYF